MEEIKIRLKGSGVMLMHSDVLSDPLNPRTKEHKQLTSKRKKTDEDHEAIAFSEWRGALYFDTVIGPYVPGQNIDAMLIEAAKLQKLGKKMKSAVMTVEDRIRLEYKGPRTIDAMFTDIRFVDARSVKVQQARLMRYRPRFEDWSVVFTIAYSSEVVEKRDIVKALEDAGRLIGLGDYRPRFGKFSVEVLD